MPARGCEMIPIEVLCEIFHLLCEEAIDLHVLENKTRFHQFPWAVGQVSRRWREAFLSYPHLWTSLRLNYATWDNSERLVDSLTEMNRRTVLYLERSRQLPLNIDLSIHSSPDRCNYPIPRATWRSLLSCSDRWKKLGLYGFRNTPSVIDDLLYHRGKYSALQSLSLDLNITTFEFRCLESALAVLPRLNDLDIYSGYGLNTPWTFPWSQLKKLRIVVGNMDSHRNRDLEAVLSQLQDVEELQLDFWRSTDLSVLRLSAPIRLASVRFLEVPLAKYPYIFELFEMPALEHLRAINFPVGAHLQDKQLWNTAIQSFISRSSCRIRRLTLECNANGLALILMEALASIEYLCIMDTHPDTTPMLIRRIASLDDGICLPNLQELHVIGCFGQVGEQLTAAMTCLLEARGNESRPGLAGHNVAPLKTVTVEWGRSCTCRNKCVFMDGKSRKNQILGEMVETIRSRSSIADIPIEKSQKYVKLYLEKRQGPIVVGTDHDG